MFFFGSLSSVNKTIRISSKKEVLCVCVCMQENMAEGVNTKCDQCGMLSSFQAVFELRASCVTLCYA